MTIIIEDKGCNKGCGYLARAKEMPFYVYDYANRKTVVLDSGGLKKKYVCQRGGEHKIETRTP